MFNHQRRERKRNLIRDNELDLLFPYNRIFNKKKIKKHKLKAAH